MRLYRQAPALEFHPGRTEGACVRPHRWRLLLISRIETDESLPFDLLDDEAVEVFSS